MKTKEFIAKIKELGYHARTEGDTIVVRVLSSSFSTSHDVHGWFKIKNITKDAYLVISEDRLIPQSDAKVLLAIAEYLSTPAEEREAEKKYCLRFPSCFDEYKYLNFNNITKKYGRSMALSTSPNDVKNIFTQKEIDDMPFDTNFFVKEEVND